MRWDGSTWNSESGAPTLVGADVWGSDANNVWVIGGNSQILKWNGSAWSEQSSGAASSLFAIWGSDANNVWAVGQSGTIVKWNGSTWNEQNSGTTDYLFGVGGSDANNVWAVSVNGNIFQVEWQHLEQAEQRHDGVAPGRLGQRCGRRLGCWRWRHDPAVEWQHLEQSAQRCDQSFSGVWGHDGNNVWVVGYDTILKWDGGAWHIQRSGTQEWLNAVWGADVNNVWAVGNGGLILKWDGSTWTPQSSGTLATLIAVWGLDASTVWAAGSEGTILKWDGSTWTPQSSGTLATLNGIWGSDANHVWAVGHDWQGVLLKWEGSGWSPAEIAERTEYLYGIWGSDANNIWAVGEDGTILKWDGNAWNDQSLDEPATLNDLYDIWGLSANNVWAVGYDGAVYRWDGAWHIQSTGAEAGLADIWGRNGSGIWTVGGTGTILWTDLLLDPLNVFQAGNGSGKVRSAPYGIDCGTTCSAFYAPDTTVTLTATAATGSSFAGWEGACTGVGRVCQVTLDAAKATTATFILNSYPLTVTKRGNGSGVVASIPGGIDCGEDCGESYLYGTVVTLTATADISSTFLTWAGACTDARSTCQVTVDLNNDATATFGLPHFLPAISKMGSGGNY